MSTTPTLNCDDSPLSITANIIAILTFVYALGVGLGYRYTIVRTAKDELYIATAEADTMIRLWNATPSSRRDSASAASLEATRALEIWSREVALLNQLRTKIDGDLARGGFVGGVFRVLLYVRWRDKLRLQIERFRIWEGIWRGWVDEEGGEEKRSVCAHVCMRCQSER
jgi:hypothetical protein